MLQALKPVCPVHFWSSKNSLFSVLALRGNKNWPPTMKVKKLANFWNKSGLTGCKWSSLNALGTQIPLSCPFLKLQEFPFIIIMLLSLWGNKKWPPTMKVKKFENLGHTIGLAGCKWSILKAPRSETPFFSPAFIPALRYPFSSSPTKTHVP